MESYQSQLESPQWQEKRNKILNRDNHRCKICGKGKTTWTKINNKFYNVGVDHRCPVVVQEEILSKKFTITEFKSFINTKRISFIKVESDLLVGISDNNILGIADINIINIPQDEVCVNLVRHNSGMLYFVVTPKDTDLSNINISTVYLKENPLFLTVHHKHYILQHKAWEYDDNDLVTLCNECHTRLHHAIGVKVYSSIKNGYMQEILLTPCKRCHGTGYFPEYKHIESGTCFRCRGARFEELIPKTSYTASLIDTDLPF